jgi:acyl-coenzyme A thioesterase PaaI-like protein
MAADGATRDATRAVGAELRRAAELLVERDAATTVLDAVAGELRGVNERLATAPARSARADHDELGPLRGAANPLAPPLRFEPSGEATARLGPAHEGPPGFVHGGWLAALFDEFVAVLQRDAGVNGLTAELTVRYRRPVPVGAELRFAGALEDDDGRSVTATAACTVNGELVASARARFVRGAMRPPAAPAGG